MPEREPYVCTAESPWDPSRGTPAIHPQAAETDEERAFGGGEYCVRMACPHCGHRWWKELPQ